MKTLHTCLVTILSFVLVSGCNREESPTSSEATQTRAEAGLKKGMPLFTETYSFSPVTCNGLDRNGIQYAFSVAGVPSGDCVAGTTVGPGITNNITRPNIEGNAAGELTLIFDVPTTAFGFGVAQNTSLSPQYVIIDLYRPGAGHLRAEILLNTTNDPVFVGGRYDYDGPAVKTAKITFSTRGPRFAVDNVTFFCPPGRS